MTDYNNFKHYLKKEQNEEAREYLNAWYKEQFPDFEIEIIDYESQNGNYLQHNGVDVILYKKNKYGGIEKQYWVQEKIVFAQYNKLMFEYKKASGADGWAVDPLEKADYLVYYHDGNIYLMQYREVRAYIRENLPLFKARYAFKTDNYNVNVPIYVLEKNIKMKCHHSMNPIAI